MIIKIPKYLHCPKYKGQPQKHVVVCLECRWRKSCNPYQIYRQPELPFNQKNSSMLCIGVKKIKIHFDTSQLCCGVVHFSKSELIHV